MTRVLSEPPKKRSVMLRKLEAHLGLSFSPRKPVGPGRLYQFCTVPAQRRGDTVKVKLHLLPF